MIWTLTPPQNQTVKVTIILAQGEWSSVKDIGPIFMRCNARQKQTFFNMGNVYVFNIGSICIHGKDLFRNFTFHQKNREQSPDETDVRHIWKVDSRTIRWDLWSDSNQLWRSSIETVIFGQWWRSHQSLAREGLCIFRFCLMPWKDQSEPNIKFCLGRKIELVQEFIIIQNFGHNWWWADGIRVAYFPGFTTLRLCNKVQEFMSKMSDPSDFLKNGSSSCRCSTTSHGDLKTMNGNAMLTLTSFLCMQEDSQQDDGHSSDLDQKRSGILLMLTDHKENDGEIRRKRKPSFPSHESIVPRNAQKQRRWKIINTLLCWWRNDWNCFSHNNFC